MLPFKLGLIKLQKISSKLTAIFHKILPLTDYLISDMSFKDYLLENILKSNQKSEFKVIGCL